MSESLFKCSNCGRDVNYKAWGTKNRNHCPFCLYSLHVDGKVGDRERKCDGKMSPVAKLIKPDGEEVVVHKCEKCGFVRKNRVAGDDSIKLVDDLVVVEDIVNL